MTVAELIPIAGTPPREFNLTDLGNAERLAHHHGRDLRFVPQIGWHVWDSTRWRPDEDGEIHRRAASTVRQLAVEAVDLGGKTGEAAAKWAFRSEASSRLAAMVEIAEHDARLVARVDDLNADHWLLNVRNGTVNLRTGELQPHNRYDHITKIAPCVYDPDAVCPQWVRFLEHAFAGDALLSSFVQRAVGYSLTGSTAAQVLFLLFGRGQNGKSTFLETVRDLLGDYAQQAPSDLLMATRGNRGGATPDLARLPGARFVSAVETGEGRRLDEPLVKQITGGDRIAARRLYRDVFEFTPTHKLWLGTNHLPEVRGTDEAIWRRIRVVPFTVRVPDELKDDDLKDKLRGELSGILTWAIAGLSSYLSDGLQVPEIVSDATTAYREEMDDIGAFLEECVELAENADAAADAVRASVLYTRYEWWSKAAGTSSVSGTAFGRQLVERGLHREKRRDGWYYLGVALKDEDQQRLN